jgi:hypothetical protein
MKKITFSILLILLFTAIIPASGVEAGNKSDKLELIRFLKSTIEKGTSGNSFLRKRKLKKTLRKGGRLYRKVKNDRASKKKSRKVQRKIRGIINIF